MVPCSVLMLTGPSFLEYCHGITQRDEDALDAAVANIAHTPFAASVPCTVRRGRRTSIVTWA